MPYITVTPQPGFYSLGTDYSSKGRYRTGDLIRWYQGVSQPIGGWRERSGEAVDGVARAALTWVDNSNQSWIGIGTNEGLFVMNRAGILTDITPLGFVPGAADAQAGGGYGFGLYGVGTYGTPRADDINVLPAASWSLDTFGENLIGVCDNDAKLYMWVPDSVGPAEEITNAPECTAVVTTQEGIIMALGADDGNGLNPRYVKWSGLQNATDWTPTTTNLSRDQLLQTQGEVMLGKRVHDGTLVLTDEGAFRATFVGPPFVYTFSRVGSGCGAISRQSAAVAQSSAYWMGRNGFFQYNGYVSPLPCDVQDYVFSDINETQFSKVCAVLVADYNEVWWLYPSSESMEVDSYVAYNYMEGIWYTGSIDRTCGTGANGALNNPIMVSSAGIVYDHDVADNRDAREPRLRTGPLEIGEGDNVIMLRRFIPDERNAGSVKVMFHARQWPNGPLKSYGPYDATSPANLRITARQMEIEYIGDPDTDFRIGNFRFEVQSGGLR